MIIFITSRDVIIVVQLFIVVAGTIIMPAFFNQGRPKVETVINIKLKQR
jgi:hypothetical protein